MDKDTSEFLLYRYIVNVLDETTMGMLWLVGSTIF